MMTEIATAKVPTDIKRGKEYVRRNKHRFKYTIKVYGIDERTKREALLGSFKDVTGKIPRQFMHTYFASNNELAKGNYVSYEWKMGINAIGGVRADTIGVERTGVITRVAVQVEYR